MSTPEENASHETLRDALIKLIEWQQALMVLLNDVLKELDEREMESDLREEARSRTSARRLWNTRPGLPRARWRARH
jgi:hypothetical protein